MVRNADSSAVARRVKVVALVILGALLVVEAAFAAPYIARAMAVLDAPDLRYVLLAVLAEVVSMGSFARVQRRMLFAGGARVPMRRMIGLTYAANAVSVSLPGGTALASGYTFKRLRSWGATVPAAGFTLLASGILSALSFALLAVASALLAGGSALSSVAVIAAAAAAGIVVIFVRRHHGTDVIARLAARALRRANRIMRRAPETGLAGLRTAMSELAEIRPRSRDWLAGLGFAELNWVADLACLVACCYAVNAHRSSVLLLTVAYLAGMGASSLSLLPGGLGVVDAAMIFTLTQGGVSTVSATAAVLLYRLISFALVVALGWLVWGATGLAERRAKRREADLGVRPVDALRGASGSGELGVGSRRGRSGLVGVQRLLPDRDELPERVGGGDPRFDVDDAVLSVDV